MDHFVESSGNIFEDLGFEDADERSLKAFLAMKVNSILEHRHITQVDAGEILDIPQPKVSNLKNGKLDSFSVERLLGFMLKLNRNVEIKISKNTSRKRASHFAIQTDGERVLLDA